MALSAQVSVPVPEGLDLDVWIVPSQQERIVDEEGDEGVRKVKKGKKGKGKEVNGVKVKNGKRRQKDDEVMETPTPEPEVETPEEREERERVSLGPQSSGDHR